MNLEHEDVYLVHKSSDGNYIFPVRLWNLLESYILKAFSNNSELSNILDTVNNSVIISTIKQLTLKFLTDWEQHKADTLFIHNKTKGIFHMTETSGTDAKLSNRQKNMNESASSLLQVAEEIKQQVSSYNSIILLNPNSAQAVKIKNEVRKLSVKLNRLSCGLMRF